MRAAPTGTIQRLSAQLQRALSLPLHRANRPHLISTRPPLLHRQHQLLRLHSTPNYLAMPLKAAVKRASKRKADDELDQADAVPSASTSTPPVKEDSPLTDLEGEDAEDDKPQKKKRAKKEPVKPLDPTLPTNKTVPDVVEPFPRPAAGCIRISAWNVAGLRASEKKGAPPPSRSRVREERPPTDGFFPPSPARPPAGFSRYVEAEDADVLIVTETKTTAIPLAALDDRYPHRYWGDHGAVKKGQAGTAIFSKVEPLNVEFGFTASDEVSAADSEGRMVTLEFENSFVVGTCASLSRPLSSSRSLPARHRPSRDRPLTSSSHLQTSPTPAKASRASPTRSAGTARSRRTCARSTPRSPSSGRATSTSSRPGRPTSATGRRTTTSRPA